MPDPILKNLNPIHDERPTVYADRIGQTYSTFIQDKNKESLGQYFTPVPIADFMSSLANDFELKKINILDPGAGTGILSCALIEQIARSAVKPDKIELIAYESDKKLIPLLKKCLDYTKVWSKEHNIDLKYKVLDKDFILENAAVLEKVKSFSEQKNNRYDYIISNPPYFKLQKSDPRVKMSSSVVYGQPNIYSLFMAISASLLTAHGEMVFITPRSFAAGSYFKLFREKFFSIVRPSYIHLFESREETFDRDSVLQENVIIKAIRDDKWHINNNHLVKITSSKGLSDLLTCEAREVPLKDVIDMYSKNKYLHIPLSEKDDDIIQLVNLWKNNLNDFDMEISTGPVVPFRARELITDKGDIERTHTPLVWMQNVKEMSIEWPISMKKSQFMLINSNSQKLFVENKNYVILRRFSPKEDNKRLKTTPYIAGTIKSQYLGLENHLNYIHRPRGELTSEEIYGLSAILNSRIIDRYIRTFNGNTEISATELRSVPLPELELIKKIGRHILKNNLSNGEIDQYVNHELLSNYTVINKDEKAEIYG